MAVVRVNSLDVRFPFEPYGCQREYMGKVLQCLQERKNGVLESPTGTGKTLSLLCATLSWQQDLISMTKRQFATPQHTEAATSSRQSSTLWDGHQVRNVPKIIYSSRTHSQLSQAIQELKNTDYRPRVSILGSRDQLCIHPSVMKASSNTEKVHLCRSKVQSRSCHFHNNMEYRGEEMSKQLSERVADIEDLVVEGSRNRVCPYFLAREMISVADLVFMPYNYILDIKSRRAHGIELANNVVIFDEAHNIERMCEDSASVDLTAYDIACCIQDVNKCIEAKQKLKDGLPGASGDLALVDGDVSDIDSNLEGMFCVKSILLALEKQLDLISITTTEGITKPGSFIQEMFVECHLKYDNYILVLEQCDKMLLQLTTDGKTFNRSFSLQKFSDMIRTVFATSSESVSCYKVHISVHSDFTRTKGIDTWASTGKKHPETVRVLSYWCFSPGHAMEELRQSGVYCVILTSGTLTPLSSFSSELKIPFPVSIESPHVIGRHQVMCGVLTCGPGNITLNSSYQTRFDKDYLDSLGKAVFGFSQKVPQGLLVFFASYPLMYKCIDTWKENGMWKELARIKPAFVEPKGKADFNQTIEGYYEKIRDPEHNAAVFFAVCRGKVAEGLDFADMNGRAVIITGLPFPPKMEPKVRLKMAYLDEQIKNSGNKSEKRKEVLTGNVWYRQQAFRAVNQAIGRVIRHKEDFGAILLCDTRFSSPEAIAQLPKWVRPVTKVYRKYNDIQQQLVAFFKQAEKMMPVPRLKAIKSTASTARTFGITQEESLPTDDPASKYQTGILFKPTKQKKERQQPVVAQFKPAQAVEDHVASLSESYVIRVEYEKFDCPVSGTEGLPCAPKKKLKIVRGPLMTVGDQSVEKKGRNEGQQKVANAKAYMAQVRHVLSMASFHRFSELLTSYKKSGDIDPLMAGLLDLFGQKQDHKELLYGIQKFLRERHREVFAKTCLDWSQEEDCMHKRVSSDASHSSPAHLPKKAKLLCDDISAGDTGMGAETRVHKDSADDFVQSEKDIQIQIPTVTSSVQEFVQSDRGTSTDRSTTAPVLPVRLQTQGGRFCPICHGKLRSPFESPCGHVCCFVCWKGTLKVSKKCPICAQPCRSKDLRKRFFISSNF